MKLSQFLEVGWLNREGSGGWGGGDFFRAGEEKGCSFYIKNKLKSEIFNNKKKFINKNFFPWEILPKNLVTFQKIGWG